MIFLLSSEVDGGTWLLIFQFSPELRHKDRVNGEDMELLGDADTSWVHPAPSLETLVDLLFLGAGSWVLAKKA